MDERVQIDKETMKALGSETRLEMLRALADRQMTESEISRKIGKHVTTVAQHMGVLRRKGLVERVERPGRRWVYYRLSRSGRRIVSPTDSVFVFGILGSVLMMAGGIVLSGLGISEFSTSGAMDSAAEASVVAEMAVASQTQADHTFILPVLLLAAGVVTMSAMLVRRYLKRK